MITDEERDEEAVNIQTDAEEIVEQLERSFTDETPGAFEKYIAAALARAEVVRTALLALAAGKVAGLPRCSTCGAALLDGAGCDPRCGG